MLRVVFAGIAFLFISLRDRFEDTVTAFTESTLGVGDSFVGIFAVTFVLALLFGILSGWIRLGPTQWTFRHEQLIAAAPSVIWDAINPRTRSDHYEQVIQRIEKVSGEEGMYLSFRQREAGAEELDPIETYILDGVREKALVLETHAPDDLYHLYQYETDLFQLEKADGGTRVSSVVTLHKPSLYFVACCLFSNPAKSTLSQLAEFSRRTPMLRSRGAMFGRPA